MTESIYDVIIVGGGPAGFTAGIYAGRSGLRSAVLEKAMTGGQMSTSYLIENWPGDAEISGQDLAQKMKEHSSKYTEIKEFSEVKSIEKEELFVISTSEGELKAKSIIVATGAEHKKLGVPGEEEYNGKGVSYCATCDGFFFKGKKVYVVGGGNTALEYAIYLESVGCDVSIIHRRDQLRAEESLQKQLEDTKVDKMMEWVVEEMKGEDMLKGLVLKNTKSGEFKEVPTDGVFIAIGEEPNNEVPNMLGLKLDEEGYVLVDERKATSVPGVYAAGDVTGGLKQIVVAAAEGAIAATSAFEDLRSPYWIKS